jgi:hypothetical protein
MQSSAACFVGLIVFRSLLPGFMQFWRILETPKVGVPGLHPFLVIGISKVTLKFLETPFVVIRNPHDNDF